MTGVWMEMNEVLLSSSWFQSHYFLLQEQMWLGSRSSCGLVGMLPAVRPVALPANLNGVGGHVTDALPCW